MDVNTMVKEFKMQQMLMMPVLIFLLCLSFSACKEEPFEVFGLKPMYFDALDFTQIRSETTRNIVDQGNIVKQGDYLFINERKQGIHVVDNSDPSLPEYILFWNIPGNRNFTINENYLYADNGPHLLVINISDFENIRFDRYVADAFFENLLEQYPEDESAGIYFECAKPELGLVKEWVPSTLINPSCVKN